MYLLKCAECDSKKSKFVRISLSRPSFILIVSKTRYKINNIVSKFLLAGDKLIPKMHLRQSGFTYSACGPFAKNKEKI